LQIEEICPPTVSLFGSWKCERLSIAKKLSLILTSKMHDRQIGGLLALENAAGAQEFLL
jgi:hypothetical protein